VATALDVIKELIGTAISPLQKPPLCERQTHSVTDDEMIKYANINQRQSVFQPLSDELIRGTGLSDSRGVLGFVSGCNHHLFR
jgi:hypothetical protein